MFLDRRDAGKQLAARLVFLTAETDLIVLGIPRGGVVVAVEVARELHALLDVFIAHKIGAPFNAELAIGALTSTGEVWFDEAALDELRLGQRAIERVVEQTRADIEHRVEMYRGKRAPLDVKNKTVVLVDDGVATGSTVLVALRALRKQNPARLILAVPVGPADTMRQLAFECDQVVVVDTPDPFFAVGRFYTQFGQTSDEEVVRLLEEVERDA
ncbi:MAG: phosphoribosyltransferase [Chloroflexi bacterium]|nr:phosphoribosyltransferase [Chloroflexota bacterium]